MTTLDEVDGWLAEHFAALLTKYDVVGGAIAVLAGGAIVDRAAGSLNRSTGVDATPDSVFQIGSITKVWTTTLAMQLVEEGRLELDAPVRRYLPEFRLADEDAAAAITVRQLMSHTAGFEGDIFTDTGRGDDCVEKYVATLGDVAQLFPPGAMFSYNNAAFCVLGRVVEVLREKPFNACLRDHLITPLGLTHTATDPYEAILYRVAVGHIDGERAPLWTFAPSNAPAGSMLAMRPRDLLTFVRHHLAGGPGLEAMRTPQVTLPKLGLMGDSWGLGWELYDWPGGAVIGHDGGTVGQSALLRVVPERGVAVALLTNGGPPIELYVELFGRLLHDLAGVELPPLPTPPPPAERTTGDYTRYAGTYASDVVEQVVSVEDGRLWLAERPKGLAAEIGQESRRVELTLLEGETFVAVEAQHGMYQPHVFVGDDGHGRALYLHTGRATKRT